MATTTSVDNSGLLNAILPAFTAESGIVVHVLPVGSGQAMNLVRRGDAAVALTHDPQAEAAAIAAGFVTSYRKIMFNDFLVVGPPGDAAGVARAQDAGDAFARIAKGRSLFASRGDNSGTFSREQMLWNKAGRRPAAGDLIETGQGMAATLRVAGEKGAYTLADRATFEQVRQRTGLVPLYEGGAELLNTYSVFLRAGVSGHEGDAARALVHWLSDGDGRRRIAAFAVNGRPVFNVWPDGVARDTPSDLPPGVLAHAR
jgi:tungstate transport system substrate-binding protein